jgi:ferredoxin
VTAAGRSEIASGADRIPPLSAGDAAEVWIDQDACTGDGICVTLAREVFELDVDGLAYVKGTDDELRTEPGATVPVPAALLLDVVQSARECPGECIHLRKLPA